MKSKTITKIVSDYYNCDISKKSRKREIIYMRAVGITLCRQYTKESLHKIGKSLNVDHATVLHALKTFKDNYIYQSEPFNVAEDFKELEDKIKPLHDNEKIKFEIKKSEGLSNERYLEYLSHRCIKLQRQVKKLQEQNDELSSVNYLKVETKFICVLKHLKDMSDSSISEFVETRLKPFKRALETRVEPKYFEPKPKVLNGY